MKQRLILGTILAVSTLLFLGVYAPNSAPMLLASSSEEFTFVRLGLIAILVSLLIYHPPRKAEFRIGLIAISVLLASVSFTLMGSYSLQLFDGLMFMEVSLLLLIEAAEIHVTKESRIKKIKVKHIQDVTPPPHKRRGLQAA